MGESSTRIMLWRRSLRSKYRSSIKHLVSRMLLFGVLEIVITFYRDGVADVGSATRAASIAGPILRTSGDNTPAG